jgi:carboxypeptidase D
MNSLAPFRLSLPVVALATVLGFGSATSPKGGFGKTLDVDLPSSEDLRVRDLAEFYPAYASFEGKMFAGSLPIDHEQPDGTAPRTGNLQFWLFVPDAPTVPNTMASWFNGGPGCSSLAFGVLFETGPVTVPLHPAGWCCEDANEPLTPNAYGWTNATVMLYVEQPIGVGFSEATNGTPPPSSEEDVAADFESFLQNFYRVFGDLKTHSLYLVGESYAGHYIPSVAHGIYLRNRDQEKGDPDGSNRIHIPLEGIAIGNGAYDAVSQEGAVIDFCYYHGLIDATTRDAMHAEFESCMAKVDMKDGEVGSTNPSLKMMMKGSGEEKGTPFHPFTVTDGCGILSAVLEAAGEGAFDGVPSGPLMYEYSTWDPYSTGNEGGTIPSFYNDINVQKALNVPAHRLGMTWQGCIPELADVDKRRRLSSGQGSSSRARSEDMKGMEHPHRKLFMDNDTPWSVVPYLVTLLDEAKIDVMLYSGDRDIICCTQGVEEVLRKMDWSGSREPAPGHFVVNSHQNAWTHAPRGLWVYNNSYPAGYIKAHKNLQFLSVYNAGHMVPYNQPGPSLDLLERVLRGESFYDRPLKSFLSGTHKESIEEQHLEQMPAKPALEKSIAAGTQEILPPHVAAESLPSSAPLVLTVAAAFFVGFVVARFTTGIKMTRGHAIGPTDSGMHGYGSISA